MANACAECRGGMRPCAFSAQGAGPAAPPAAAPPAVALSSEAAVHAVPAVCSVPAASATPHLQSRHGVAGVHGPFREGARRHQTAETCALMGSHAGQRAGVTARRQGVAGGSRAATIAAARTQQAALRAAADAGLTFGGQPLETVSSIKYLWASPSTPAPVCSCQGGGSRSHHGGAGSARCSSGSSARWSACMWQPPRRGQHKAPQGTAAQGPAGHCSRPLFFACFCLQVWT